MCNENFKKMEMVMVNEGKLYDYTEALEDMNPAQKRLLRSLNSLLHHISLTKNEAEFFDSSAQAFRLVSSIINQSNFNQKEVAIGEIPFGDQALEYSMDYIIEMIEKKKIICYDN